MELVFLLPIFVAFVVPVTRQTVLQLVHIWLDSRAMVRELFDPIVARLKSAAKHGDMDVNTELLADMDIDNETDSGRKEKQREWHQSGSDAARLGFGLIFCCMLQIPFIGPFTWFLGFASAGLVAPELVDLHAFGRSSHKK